MNAQYLSAPQYPYIDYVWDVAYLNVEHPAFVDSSASFNVEQPALADTSASFYPSPPCSDVASSNTHHPTPVDTGAVLYPSPPHSNIVSSNIYQSTPVDTREGLYSPLPYTNIASTDLPTAAVSEDPFIEMTIKMINSLQEGMGTLLPPLDLWLNDLIRDALSADTYHRKSARGTLEIACFLMDSEKWPLPPEIASLNSPHPPPPPDPPQRVLFTTAPSTQGFGDSFMSQPQHAHGSAWYRHCPPLDYSHVHITDQRSTLDQYQRLDAKEVLPIPLPLFQELPATTTIDPGIHNPYTEHGPEFMTRAGSHLSQPTSLPDGVDNFKYSLGSSRSSSQDNGYPPTPDIHAAPACGSQPK
ncbi:hypothetical protein CPB83DRAFT_845035 [Crepidotus variabilis]|uniref:Uncharacterized protein n=1 Tax=Crepidotus variabilis TaxID=179855 RepID=A0A9P6JVM7_9AGAR|nr:hypothetical protein CPB83DRAFT_845035 [Crepidotus variabilis]